MGQKNSKFFKIVIETNEPIKIMSEGIILVLY